MGRSTIPGRKAYSRTREGGREGEKGGRGENE